MAATLIEYAAIVVIIVAAVAPFVYYHTHEKNLFFFCLFSFLFVLLSMNIPFCKRVIGIIIVFS